MSSMPQIYIATVLLEKNRWDSRIPSFRVSDWQERFAEAGFDGIELWENHLLLSDDAEWEAVKDGPLPVTVLSTYCNFEDGGIEGRSASAELARYFDVSAVKFKFGNAPDRAQEYFDNLLVWKEALPEGCRLLCESHSDTIVEEPEAAARILKPLRDQVEINLHAFSGENGSTLDRWLDEFGTAVTHIHVVLPDRTHTPHRIEMLKRAGFSGTYTIEFCKGVNEPPEDMDRLLATAADDLRYLRGALA